MRKRKHRKKPEFICTRCGQGTSEVTRICGPCWMQTRIQKMETHLEQVKARVPRRPNGFEERFRVAVERVQNGRKAKEPKPEPYQPVSGGITLERPKRAIRMEED